MIKYLIIFSSILLFISCNNKKAKDTQKKEIKTTNEIVGNVLKTMNASKYTYAQIKTTEGNIWVAGPKTEIKVGEKLSVSKGLLMKKYFSKTLKREFKEIYFVTSLKGKKRNFHGSHSMMAEKSNNPHKRNPHSVGVVSDFKIENIKKATDGFTISELYNKRTELKGKDVKVRGIVVKYSPLIMNKNWIHIQDGSADDQTGDLALNSLQEVKEGQQILVSGKLTTDKDFGYGYKYDLIILDAKFKIEK